MSGIIINQADDIDAIARYIEDQALKSDQFPDLKNIIPRFRRWFNDLGFYAKYIDMTTLDQARAYRDEVNKAEGIAPLPGLPQDKESDQPQNSFSPVKTGIYIGAGACLRGLVLIKILLPRR
jgi:hypothetical protein